MNKIVCLSVFALLYLNSPSVYSQKKAPAAAVQKNDPVQKNDAVQKNETLQKNQTQANIVNNAFMNLASANLIMAPAMSGPEKKAATMLLEEVEKRSNIRWPVSNAGPKTGTISILLGRRAELAKAYPEVAAIINAAANDKPEGYRIVTVKQNLVIVAGNDERGVLFGAGHLLRLLD
ncbi:MAG TPA: glycoside hydrolase family 20 zincin-like fold domain-containing protein, partial [Flavitalea sp.]|nr:glycoside hydrolase family 20 zincin-like fold domain-containing protein [Flavitalea sp.]